MPTEIERKFLLNNDLWRDQVSHSVRLRDGLVAYCNGRKVRIRFYDDRATLTIKGPRKGLTRDEFEYEIPPGEGMALLADHCSGDVLEKTRHHVPFAGFEWVVDEYHGILDGVIVAEVELPDEAAQFRRPPWLGAEVTGNDAYRKINMLKARRDMARGAQPEDGAQAAEA